MEFESDDRMLISVMALAHNFDTVGFAKIEEIYKYALYVAVVPSCQMILHSLTCERWQFRLLRQRSALL